MLVMKSGARRAPRVVEGLGVRVAAGLILLDVVTPAHGIAAESSARITFVVAAPASTPADAVLWISGNLAELGSWNGSGVRLAALGERRYAATVALPASAAVEFKVTRGSWDTVEKGPQGEEIANRRMDAKDGDSVRVVVAQWRDQTADRAAPKPSTRTGDVHVHAAFPSRYVQPRDVLVWLPPGYSADSTRHYPVLYFHDGNNVFDDSTSFVGEWRLDETAARLIAAGTVRPFIAVAVYNTPDRIAEYTPVADAHHGGGRAGGYARFLIEELMPFIDHSYQTRRDPASTGIVGSSLGGLVSLSIAFDHPDVFGLVGVVSPSAWWGDRWIVKRAAHAPRSLRIWLDIGTAEAGTPAEAAHEVEGVRALRDALLARGLPEKSLHYEAVEGAHHNEAAWSARLDRILEFLLPPAPR